MLKKTTNDIEIDKNSQKIGENEQKLPKYESPETKNDLNEGHFVKFKGKIGKIIKVIE